MQVSNHLGGRGAAQLPRLVASKLPPEDIIHQARVWVIFLTCAIALVFVIGISLGWWM